MLSLEKKKTKIEKINYNITFNLYVNHHMSKLSSLVAHDL